MTKRVVAIGVFDGVHPGHQLVLQQARSVAPQAALVAASFDPHPASVLRPDDFLGLLTLPERRAELLHEAGADEVAFLTFDSHMRRMSPDEFVDEVIVGSLEADHVVVGENFRFGAKATGDVATLTMLGEKFGVDVHVVPLAGDASPWSSTRARTLLVIGDVKAATQALGREHRLIGTVVHGDHRGRELGFPTANLDVAGGLLVPADGVYAARASWDGHIACAAVSIGTNPTFDDVLTRRVEAHVLDWPGVDLYDKQMTLDFVDHVRPMATFSSIDALVAAMYEDVRTVRQQLDGA